MTPRKHRHADMIRAWLDDDSLIPQFNHTEHGWITTDHPAWSELDEYRFKPKMIAVGELELAMSEMEETATDLAELSLSPSFAEQLERIRLDMSVSPFLALTDEMCKWVILAYKRSLTEVKE